MFYLNDLPEGFRATVMNINGSDHKIAAVVYVPGTGTIYYISINCEFDLFQL